MGLVLMVPARRVWDWSDVVIGWLLFGVRCPCMEIPKVVVLLGGLVQSREKCPGWLHR